MKGRGFFPVANVITPVKPLFTCLYIDINLAPIAPAKSATVWHLAIDLFFLMNPWRLHEKIDSGCCRSLGLLSATAVMAQSTVTLYGLVDAGYNRVPACAKARSTRSPAASWKARALVSAVAEDLGGGYKAIFVLENRFETDTGALSNRPNSGTQVPDRIGTTVLANLSAIPLTTLPLQIVKPSLVALTATWQRAGLA